MSLGSQEAGGLVWGVDKKWGWGDGGKRLNDCCSLSTVGLFRSYVGQYRTRGNLWEPRAKNKDLLFVACILLSFTEDADSQKASSTREIMNNKAVHACAERVIAFWICTHRLNVILIEFPPLSPGPCLNFPTPLKMAEGQGGGVGKPKTRSNHRWSWNGLHGCSYLLLGSFTITKISAFLWRGRGMDATGSAHYLFLRPQRHTHQNLR